MYTFQCLGELQIWQDGELLAPSLQGKTLAMVAYLACMERPQPRQTLAQLFCSEANDQAASLRWHINRIRKALGADFLIAEGALLSLPRERIQTDITSFAQALQGTLTQQTDEALEAALSLYRGEFLQGCQLKHAPHFEIWLTGQRSRFALLYEKGMQERIQRLLAAHQHTEVMACVQKLLELDPLREELHSLLMWLYARQGQREAAIQQYELCRELHRQQLDVALLPETEDLYQQILEGDFAPTYETWLPQPTKPTEAPASFTQAPASFTEALQAIELAEGDAESCDVSSAVQSLLQQKLFHLSEAQQQVFAWLAVFDKPATLTQLLLASTQSESVIVSALEWGIAWRLVTGVPDHRGECYEFVHASVRQAILETLSSVRLQLLHKRVAQALEQTFSTPAILAYHWRHAGVAEKECLYAGLAAEQAIVCYAYDDAITYLSRCMELSHDAEQRLDYERNLGEILQIAGRWDEAEQRFQSVLVASRRLRLPHQFAKSALLLGQFALARGELERAQHWLTQARRYFLNVDDKEGAYLACGSLGKAYRQQGAWSEALRVYQEQVSLADELQHTVYRCESYGAMSSLYVQMGELDLALSCFETTLQIATQEEESLDLLDDEPPPRKDGLLTISKIMNHAGFLQAEQDSYMEALSYFEQQLSFSGESGQMDRVHRGWEHLSTWYTWLGDYHRALSFLKRHFELAAQQLSFPGLSKAAGNLGGLYQHIGAYQEAQACYAYKLSIAIDLQEKRGIASSLSHLADVLHAQEKLDLAEQCGDTAIHLCRNHGYLFDLLPCLLSQATLYAQQGRRQDANELLDEAHDCAQQLGADTYLQAVKEAREQLQSGDRKPPVTLQKEKLPDLPLQIQQFHISLERQLERMESID